MKKKFLSLFTCLAMVLTIMPMSVLAEEDGVSYIERSWNGEKVVENEKECEDYVVVDANTTILENGKWYVVKSNVTNNNRIEVSGTVNLILCNEVILDLPKGIENIKGNTLNIYGQFKDRGEISAKADCDKAGIGGDYMDKGGSINIYGGKITATGGQDGSGIGGGNTASGGNFSIYGGTVSATGGDNGAGIGGGAEANGGFVNIYGGVVNATGGANAAGIGSGNGRELNGGDVNIYGGTVSAIGGDNGAGIGGGAYCNGATVYIHGGSVTATGGDNGAGIGGGYKGNGGNFAVYGGTVTAYSGGEGRAIGAGYGGESDKAFVISDEMFIRAGDEAPGTKMTLEEYIQKGCKYICVAENISVKGDNWYIDLDGILHITGDIKNSDYECPWEKYKADIIKVVTKDGAKIGSGFMLFEGCENLTAADLSKLDTASVKDFSRMFKDCKVLQTVNVGAMNTSNATAIDAMFFECESLTALDLSSFDTSKVVDMGSMFYMCKNLKTLDISGLTVDNVKTSFQIIEECPQLSEIKINGNGLQEIAEDIYKISSTWYDNDNHKKYTSVDELKAIEGTVTLSKNSVANEMELAVENNNFSVTLNGIDAKTGVVIVGVYNNEELLEAKLFDISKKEIPQGSFKTNGKVKAFWWKDLETLIPMCDFVEK